MSYLYDPQLYLYFLFQIAFQFVFFFPFFLFSYFFILTGLHFFHLLVGLLLLSLLFWSCSFSYISSSLSLISFFFLILVLADISFSLLISTPRDISFILLFSIILCMVILFFVLLYVFSFEMLFRIQPDMKGVQEIRKKTSGREKMLSLETGGSLITAFLGH